MTNLGFGSPQVVEDGRVVLRATLAISPQAALRHDVKNAVRLFISGQKAKEVAVEGEPAAGGERYGSDFGSPALYAADGNLFVAFTNRNAQGSSLFVGRPWALLRAVSTGEKLPQVWLPICRTAGRAWPLMDPWRSRLRTGVALCSRGACGRAVRRGKGRRPRGRRPPYHRVCGSGLDEYSNLYVEAADERERDEIYSFPVAGPRDGASSNPRVVSGDVEVFPLSLAVNRSDQYAFLALWGRLRPSREDTGTVSPYPRLKPYAPPTVERGMAMSMAGIPKRRHSSCHNR